MRSSPSFARTLAGIWTLAASMSYAEEAKVLESVPVEPAAAEAVPAGAAQTVPAEVELPVVASVPAPALALVPLPTIRPIRSAQGRTVNFEIREIHRDGFVGVPAESAEPVFVEWIRVDLEWLAAWQRDIDHHRNVAPLYTGTLRGQVPEAKPVLPPLPANGVLLEVETERASALDTRWADTDGSFDRDAYAMRRLAVSVRPMAKGDPNVRVEWYFVARNVNSRAPWIFDAGAEDVELEQGRTNRFMVESAHVRSTEYRLREPETSDYRARSGHSLSGYAVLVWSGDNLVAFRGNTPATVEWVRERVRNGTTRRPEPGARWEPSEDDMPRVVTSPRVR